MTENSKQIWLLEGKINKVNEKLKILEETKELFDFSSEEMKRQYAIAEISLLREFKNLNEEKYKLEKFKEVSDL